MRLAANRKGHVKMNGYGSEFGGIWMILVTVLVVLAILSLAKYLRK